MMLQGHFIDTLLNPAFRDQSNLAFRTWSYFRGITAPTFFAISGLVFAYLLLKAHRQGKDSVRIKKGVNRGLLLIVTGYLLRVNFLEWFSGHFSSRFLAVDVLQCIGVSLIVLIGLHLLFRRYSYLYSVVLFVIGFLCFLTEPLYRNIVLNDAVPLLFANYISNANGSVFTILPWFGYSVFGAFTATIFFRHVQKAKFRILSIISFLLSGYFLSYHSSWALMELYRFTDIDLFYRSANYNYLFSRFGDVLILFGLFYSMENVLKMPFIIKIGQKTLLIYVIHFIVLYGSFTGFGLKNYLSKSLQPHEAVVGALFFIIVVCLLSYYYIKTNAYIYSKFKIVMDKIKRKLLVFRQKV